MNHDILFLLFNEVDSLAAIDMSLGKPSFSADKLRDWLFTGPRGYEPIPGTKRFRKADGKGRVPHFLTQYSKDKYNELSKELILYTHSL